MSTTGVAASAIAAAVLIFRGAIYWITVPIGVVWESTFSVRALGTSNRR